MSEEIGIAELLEKFETDNKDIEPIIYVEYKNMGASVPYRVVLELQKNHNMDIIKELVEIVKEESDKLIKNPLIS